MAWIGRVATNFILDYFKKEGNRQQLQPTESLGETVTKEEETAYRYTAEVDLLPVLPVRPSGSGPDADD